MIISVYILYSVNSNAHTTPVRNYGEPYTQQFCAVDIFFEFTRRQAISFVAKFHHALKVWFHDSAGDIDFDQISLSQSESTILHESIILYKY